MATKRQPSQLSAALEAFGRNGWLLEGASLEAIPDILVALYGEKVLADPKALRDAADRVAHLLQSIISVIEGPVDRRIAEAVFVTRPEFRGLNVTERQEHEEERRAPGFTRDQFKTRRPLIVAYVAGSLLRLVDPENDCGNLSFSREARSAAKELYAYAQETLLYIEAYDLVVRCVKSPEWPTRCYEKARGVLGSQSDFTDQAFWAFAHCQRYLSILRRDLTGREFLSEFLPGFWWRTQLNAHYRDSELAEIESALAELEVDNPEPLVERLCRDSRGQNVYDLWLRLLSSDSPMPSKERILETPNLVLRHQLRIHLVLVCMLLKAVFPEGTWPVSTAEKRHREVVETLTLCAWSPSGFRQEDDEAQKCESIVGEAVRNRPPRLLFGGDEEISRIATG